jgi:hypothetical protein
MSLQAEQIKRLLKAAGKSRYTIQRVRANPAQHRCEGGKMVSVELKPHESGVFLGECALCKIVFVR